jgi:hypothetical protein
MKDTKPNFPEAITNQKPASATLYSPQSEINVSDLVYKLYTKLVQNCRYLFLIEGSRIFFWFVVFNPTLCEKAHWREFFFLHKLCQSIYIIITPPTSLGS